MDDVLVAPFWMGATLMLVWAAWLASQRLFPRDSLRSWVMHTVVFSWACIVGVSTVLGSVGWLSPALLLASVSMVAGLVLWLCRGTRWSSYKLRAMDLPDSPLSSAGDNSADLPSPTMGLRQPIPWLLLWSLILAWGSSWIVVRGLLSFPDDWDCLYYHMPLIVQWLHRGSLYAPADALWYTPGNNELLGLWLVGPFSGDFLIALVNLPSILLLAVGTAELVDNLGLDRPWQHLTALAVLAAFPVIRQLASAKNDGAVVGLFIAILAYGVRYARRDRSADLALAAIVLGLLAGVKYYALGYAGVAGAGLVFLLLVMRGLRAAGHTALILTIGVCLWGGYWYARNLWMTGSPIYPQGLTESNDFLRHVRTSSGQSTVWQTTLLGNGKPAVFPLLRKAIWNLTGPCHAAATLLLFVVIAWLIGSGVWLHRQVESRGLIRLAIAFWIVGAGFVWIVIPFAAEHSKGTLDSLREGNTPIRYGLCFLSLCVVGLALVVQDLLQALHRLLMRTFPRSPEEMSPVGNPVPPRGQTVLLEALSYLTLGIVGAAIIYQFKLLLAQKFFRTELFDVSLLALNLWISGAIAVFLWHRWPRLRRTLTAVLAPGLFTGAVVAVGFLAQHWHDGFAANYEAQGWQRLSETLQTSEPSTTRICALAYTYYPLFGSRRQFRVTRPYWLPSTEAAIQYFHDQDISLVVAMQFDPIGARRYDGKSAWLRENPELFPPLQDNIWYFICRVNRDHLQKSLAAR